MPQDPKPANPQGPRNSERSSADVPVTEAQVDSPRRHTLVLLGILAAATAAIWYAGESACNYHPPRETRLPRKVSTRALAGTAKDAAIELQQRWLTNRYAEAAELAKGEVKAQLDALATGCDAECKEQGKKLAEKVTTTAVVLGMSRPRPPAGVPTALVKAVSDTADGQKAFRMQLQREGNIWKVLQRKEDKGEPIEARFLERDSKPKGKSGGAAGAGGGGGAHAQ